MVDKEYFITFKIDFYNKREYRRFLVEIDKEGNPKIKERPNDLDCTMEIKLKKKIN